MARNTGFDIPNTMRIARSRASPASILMAKEASGAIYSLHDMLMKIS